MTERARGRAAGPENAGEGSGPENEAQKVAWQAGLVLYVDPAVWPGRGRLWAHLVSDVSYCELHAFAEMLGAPRRGFDRDHYDLPEERVPVAVWLGAVMVPSREIVVRLAAAGLRRRKFVRR
jgi:hypothetical protein